MTKKQLTPAQIEARAAIAKLLGDMVFRIGGRKYTHEDVVATVESDGSRFFLVLAPGHVSDANAYVDCDCVSAVAGVGLYGFSLPSGFATLVLLPGLSPTTMRIAATLCRTASSLLGMVALERVMGMARDGVFDAQQVAELRDAIEKEIGNET